MSKLTDKQFKTKLTGLIKSAKNQRETIQVLILAGIEQHIEKNRTNFLSDLLASTVSVKSLPSVTIKDFIKEHTNLKYAKNKAGEYMFLKDKTSTNENVMPTINWYEFNKPKAAKDKPKATKAQSIAKVLKGAELKDIEQALLINGITTTELMRIIDMMTTDGLKLAA